MSPARQLQERAPAIPPDQERELRVYVTMGGSVGLRSADGPTLDRARASARVQPCRTCHGDPATWRAGTGAVWGSGPESRHRRGLQLEHQRAVHAFLGLGDPGEHDVHGDQVCPTCQGTGWVMGAPRARAERWDGRGPRWARGAVRQTWDARPRGSSREAESACPEPDTAALTLIGVVSRRLLAVGDRHAGVLCAYYLPSPVHESLRALWPLTPAGRTLLRASHPDTSPWQAIVELLQAQDAAPTPKRAAQFAAADTQAADLLEAARWAWSLATRTPVEALAVDVLGEVAP